MIFSWKLYVRCSFFSYANKVEKKKQNSCSSFNFSFFDNTNGWEVGTVRCKLSNNYSLQICVLYARLFRMRLYTALLLFYRVFLPFFVAWYICCLLWLRVSMASVLRLDFRLNTHNFRLQYIFCVFYRVSLMRTTCRKWSSINHLKNGFWRKTAVIFQKVHILHHFHTKQPQQFVWHNYLFILKKKSFFTFHYLAFSRQLLRYPV